MDIRKILQFTGRHWFAGVMSFAVLFLLVISDHSYYQIRKLRSEQNEVKRQIARYREQTAKYRAGIGEVSVDDKTKLEEYARTRLGMKRPGEEVFLFDE